MVKQTIQIFVRIKPSKVKIGQYDVGEDQEKLPMLTFHVPKDLSEGLVNNKKEQYKFKFEKIFDQAVKQDEIFDGVAKPVVDNVLEGYNGTIFAYGQTSSGKTFTITGGAERYIDRGIIPRTLSYIFDHYQKNSDLVYNTYVSYLEIYNENGYDLLDPQHEGAKLEDLPKVLLMEDNDQNIHLKNLSTHQANNEEDALNLLFLGDTNRMIAETPMNQASTRSHCIFTIHITSRESGSATIRRSKLHLVDLAGSERVGKTGVNGVLLTEAKYINLSLHYLEQVIVALSEKSRLHIPYRNSMMTSVLRDSLGGNCMTTMIATCSVERKNIDESMSTCRFAQRVALIKNEAILNEELDPKLMIARLKRQIQQLKDELAMATGEQRTDALSAEDLERCFEAVQSYLEDKDSESQLNIGADMRKIHECFRLLKKQVLERAAGVSGAPAVSKEDVPPEMSATEKQKLTELLRQRDDEINILVGMLKKERRKATDALSRLQGAPLARTTSSNGAECGSCGRPPTGNMAAILRSNKSDVGTSPDTMNTNSSNVYQSNILGQMSMGRQEAFDVFRREYDGTITIEDNKKLLKQRYAEAKQLGEHVNQARANINKLKAGIEQHRMSQVMQGLMDPEKPVADQQEENFKTQIEQQKDSYKEAFKRLRALKTEIEHLQHLLERSKVKLMKDFEIWWAEQAATAQHTTKVKQLPAVKSAWKTAPPSSLGEQGTLSQSQSSLASGVSAQSSPRSSRIGSQPAFDRATPLSSTSDTIQLTGDDEADANIIAFLKARQTILSHSSHQKRPR